MSAAVRAIRQGIQQASASLDQAEPVAGRPEFFTYVPPTHARALDPEATLVEGIRGAGKSFWWAQLASPSHRLFIQETFPEARLPAELKVAQGFGNGLSQSQAPDAEVLSELVKQYKPRSIWRAVIALHAGFTGMFAEFNRWERRVGWVQANPEEFAEQLEAANQKLSNEKETLLVLFDALDRLADDWQHINPLVKGLLQVALDMRSTKRIRCKVYLRPDILQDEGVTSFADYSKLLAGKASLEWRRADLYALLFQCLGNTTAGGKEFRELADEALNNVSASQSLRTWKVPSQLRIDETQQEALFERIAGKAMGSSTKRGKPYTWLVNHLQDGFNQVSPRSFFAALGTAASEISGDDELPLNYRGIQRGVQQASQIRVKEITEDYPWVKLVMEPLRGNLTVPCLASDIEKIWQTEKTLSRLESRLGAEGNAVKLPPQNIDQGPPGILIDLESLGMVQRIDGKRVQMPDVYRVAFGLGRRGGVKPLK
jgi:hypothetical protein